MKIIPRFFEFTSYKFEPKQKKITFNYRIEFSNKEPLNFSETILLPKIPSLKNIPQGLLENLLKSIHLILGISYYKLYCPPAIKLQNPLSKEQAEFWSTVYKKGLGEFSYQNKIDPAHLGNFPYDKKFYKQKEKLEAFDFPRKDRALIGIGGGKDSIVAFELLKEQKQDLTALLIETQKGSEIAEKVIKTASLPTLKIERFLDPKIFEKHQGSFNGHIPISAIFAFLGLLAGVLYDYSSVIVANEFSSDFGNIKYKGEIINHQWSKSSEFEKLFQDYTRKFITSDVVYCSPLRPFYEIRIVEMFSKYKKYFGTFSSCNRNFKVFKERQKTLWCGECAKCLFIFALLSAFLTEAELLKIFGKNLYEDPKLLPLFKDLLGFGKLKPFDCVGTFDETQVAFYLAKAKFKNTLALKTFLPQIEKQFKNKSQAEGLKMTIKKVFQTNAISTLPTHLKFLGIKNVLILGYGKEGKITEAYLRKNYPKLKIEIADQNSDPNYLQKQNNFDLAIKTPGIPKKNLTIPYTTATNIFFSQIKNQTIGITGSKGKSTTSSLIYEILKTAGKKVRLVGNIGKPMLEVLLNPIDPEEIFVLELSSYQLDDLEFSPNIALVLNLFPEHMNYHGDVEKYYEAKKNIINFQKKSDFFIYNSKDKNLKNWPKKANAVTISFNGSQIKNAAREKLLKTIKIPLLGGHNEENIRAAIAVAQLLKIPEKTIKKAIENFHPLPHRLQYLGQFKGIKFYDDAISTTPESTIMAIKALKNIGTIFLGGEDRGYKFTELEKIIRAYKIKNIVLFPDSGKKIFTSRKGLNILETSSMEQAVKFAYSHTPKKSICLLSTASPSYSLWKNFEEKGDQFQEFVKKFS